jgi:hypothetical protein
MPYEAGLLALLFIGVLGYLQVAHRERVRLERRALFDGCRRGFDEVVIRQDGIDYPVLNGRYGGFDVHIGAVVDHIALRRLPQLLAVVTLRAPVPCRAVVDVLARPQNTEFYSPWSGLPYGVDSAPHWPAHALMRTNHRGPLPFLDVLDRRMPLFEDLRVKELLVAPRGVRVVYLLKEGERGPYLLLRQAVFDAARLDAQLAERLLHVLIALHEDLCGASSPRRRSDVGAML